MWDVAGIWDFDLQDAQKKCKKVTTDRIHIILNFTDYFKNIAVYSKAAQACFIQFSLCDHNISVTTFL